MVLQDRGGRAEEGRAPGREGEEKDQRWQRGQWEASLSCSRKRILLRAMTQTVAGTAHD